MSKLIILVALVALAQAGPLNSKIDPVLQKSLQSKTLVNVLVSIQGGTEAPLKEVTSRVYTKRGDSATAVYNALTAHAQATQQNVLAMLNSPSTKFFPATKVETLWITNQISVQGASKSLIESLAALPEVSLIAEEEFFTYELPVEADPTDVETPGILAEWGIEKIRAPEAWAAYGNGTGAVIGVIDTGAKYTHEALRDSYRGGSHSWYNPITNTQTPVDGDGHGTHCTGTIAGSHGIGVAPGAKWISCKGLDDNGSGSSTNLIKCGQFMACPTHWDGSNADCTQHPDAVSNSWGGAGGREIYDAMVSAWHAAGVIPVSSLGNNGPSCRSSGTPGDSRSGILGIGATTNTDAIASFSSRGPSNWDEQKPEVAAPGSNVRSASIASDSSYTNLSGTSMACPHVAGLIGLMKAKNRNANYEQIKTVLQNTAERNLVTTGETCSGVSDSQWPNYKFGYGRIDALRAVQAI